MESSDCCGANLILDGIRARRSFEQTTPQTVPIARPDHAAGVSSPLPFFLMAPQSGQQNEHEEDRDQRYRNEDCHERDIHYNLLLRYGFLAMRLPHGKTDDRVSRLLICPLSS